MEPTMSWASPLLIDTSMDFMWLEDTVLKKEAWSPWLPDQFLKTFVFSDDEGTNGKRNACDSIRVHSAASHAGH
jgi:hypothetical protein